MKTNVNTSIYFKRWIWALLLAGMFFPLRSQENIRFSLLTCEPGSEIYALFGHTALRCQNFTDGTDWVFNYGMFSFNTPNFVYRFVKGETDYQLGVTPFRYFEAEYAMRGSSVYQQVLNLTPEESLRLFELLRENYRPENRVYRYNYFYDNCTTRARDQIERAVCGKVVYPDGVKGKSFRSIVHEFTAGSSWDEFGIDLCLGAEADREIDARKQMFAPFYMRDFAARAYIEAEDGSRRPLVLEETKVVDVASDADDAEFPLSPFVCGLMFLFVNAFVAWMQRVRGKIYWGWDIFIYGLQGLAGCVIAFLFFVSSHPTVGSNWVLWLLNPLPLIYLPFMVYRTRKHKKDVYHLINAVYLTLFIVLSPCLPQEFNLTVVPLALGLLVNAASHIFVLKKK